MKAQQEINRHIATHPEPKRSELSTLHELVLSVDPGCKLWYYDGKDSQGKVVANPTIGYGTQVLRYANGKTREWFRIGISGNKTGISVYLLGIADKGHLAKAYGKTIGKASVTGYCIKFKTISDIKLDVLEKAIRFGMENGN
ncbi:MAG: DUF1801 domain-containing protein [Bacteroidia bacterium]|nr:DUF1801 domain-containing protein [Bacteroidia bacterium]